MCEFESVVPQHALVDSSVVEANFEVGRAVKVTLDVLLNICAIIHLIIHRVVVLVVCRGDMTCVG